MPEYVITLVIRIQADGLDDAERLAQSMAAPFELDHSAVTLASEYDKPEPDYTQALRDTLSDVMFGRPAIEIDWDEQSLQDLAQALAKHGFSHG